MPSTDEPDISGALAAHVRAAARPDTETERLAGLLTARAWPGGAADRSDPVARAWLRMAGPGQSFRSRLTCSCAEGRCRICN